MKLSHLIIVFSTLLFQSISISAAEMNPKVRITTNKGIIDVVLFADKAPITVNNILKYIDRGFYDNTIFHRVIRHFMIQGGGYDTDYKKKKTANPIPNEAYNGLKNLTGTLAMARTSDPHSASSQFFINVRDNQFLDFEVAPYGPLNTVRQSQLGIQDKVTGRVATTDCHGKPITRNTLSQAKKPENAGYHRYECLMQAILNDDNYSLDSELKRCLAQIEVLKQEGKLDKNQTCSDYANNRYQSIKLVHLRWGYTVFGKVVHSYDTVKAIENTATGSAGPFRKDAPKEVIIIQSIKRL